MLLKTPETESMVYAEIQFNLHITSYQKPKISLS